MNWFVTVTYKDLMGTRSGTHAFDNKDDIAGFIQDNLDDDDVGKVKLFSIFIIPAPGD